MRIYSECLRVYETRGQHGVFDLVTSKYPWITWEYCTPCEVDSPVLDQSCLVCGSVI